MSKLRIVATIITAVTIAGCATKTNVKQCNPALLSEDCTIRRVAIMPIEITVDRSTVKGTAESYDMGDDLAKMMEDAAASVLPRFEFEVVDNGLDQETLEEYPDLKYDLANLREQILNIEIQTEEDLFASNGYVVTDERIKNGQMTLGLDVAPFAEDCGADALLFIVGRGMIHSEGKQALGLAAGVLTGVQVIYTSQMVYRAVLVDGRDGKVLMLAHGITYLSDFDGAKDKPGGEQYNAKLEKLKPQLEKSLSNMFSRMLERDPAETDNGEDVEVPEGTGSSSDVDQAEGGESVSDPGEPL